MSVLRPALALILHATAKIDLIDQDELAKAVRLVVGAFEQDGWIMAPMGHALLSYKLDAATLADIAGRFPKASPQAIKAVHKILLAAAKKAPYVAPLRVGDSVSIGLALTPILTLVARDGLPRAFDAHRTADLLIAAVEKAGYISPRGKVLVVAKAQAPALAGRLAKAAKTHGDIKPADMPAFLAAVMRPLPHPSATALHIDWARVEADIEIADQQIANGQTIGHKETMALLGRPVS